MRSFTSTAWQITGMTIVIISFFIGLIADLFARPLTARVAMQQLITLELLVGSLFFIQYILYTIVRTLIQRALAISSLTDEYSVTSLFEEAFFHKIWVGPPRYRKEFSWIPVYWIWFAIEMGCVVAVGLWIGPAMNIWISFAFPSTHHGMIIFSIVTFVFMLGIGIFENKKVS